MSQIKDREHNDQINIQKDKRWSTKHYTENLRWSNTYPLQSGVKTGHPKG